MRRKKKKQAQLDGGESDKAEDGVSHISSDLRACSYDEGYMGLCESNTSDKTGVWERGAWPIDLTGG